MLFTSPVSGHNVLAHQCFSIFNSDFYSNPFLLAMVQIKQASKHTTQPPVGESTKEQTHYTARTGSAISFKCACQFPTASHLTHQKLTTSTTYTSLTREKYSRTSLYLCINTIRHTTRLGIFCLTHLLSPLSRPLWTHKRSSITDSQSQFLWHDTTPPILHYTTPPTPLLDTSISRSYLPQSVLGCVGRPTTPGIARTFILICSVSSYLIFRERERQRDRETERQRDREREREMVPVVT